MKHFTIRFLACSRILLLGIGCLVLPHAGLAQDEGVLRVNTRLVEVDVVVTGGDGAVGSLTPLSFRLYDNDVPQEIAVFELVETASAGDATPLPEGIVSNRVGSNGVPLTSATIVLLDRLNTGATEQTWAIQELQKYLESTGPEDRIGIYELRRRLSVLADYTVDRDRLVEIAGALAAEHSLELASSDSSGGFESELSDTGLDRELAEFLGRGGGGDGFGLLNPRAERLSSDYQLDARARSTAIALEELALRMAGLPGRKTVVWLSDRFPFTYDVFRRSDLAQEIEPSTMRLIERAGMALNRANVAVYPVDLGAASAGVSNETSVLELIAERTGGAASPGTTDIAGVVRRAVDEGRTVYRLGFYPTEASDGAEFRRLRVEVDRENVDVRYRKGYYGFSEETPADADLETALAEALVSPVDATALSLTARAAPSPADPGSYDLLMLIDIRHLSLRMISGRRIGTFNVLMYFSPDGEEEGLLIPTETYPVSLTEEQYQRTLGTGFAFRRSVEVDDLRGGLRIVVQDRLTGAIGSLWVPVA